jgi:hypothetical protein
MFARVWPRILTRVSGNEPVDEVRHELTVIGVEPNERVKKARTLARHASSRGVEALEDVAEFGVTVRPEDDGGVFVNEVREPQASLET